MGDCSSRMFNVEFTDEEVNAAIKNGRLLSMEIEFSTKCNFQCPYCYAKDDSFWHKELELEQIEDVIIQAKDLGARKIIILGGEPLVYTHILEVLSFIRKQHLEVEMFTNGSQINEVVANTLFDLGINVVLKMNSFKNETVCLLRIYNPLLIQAVDWGTRCLTRYIFIPFSPEISNGLINLLRLKDIKNLFNPHREVDAV